MKPWNTLLEREDQQYETWNMLLKTQGQQYETLKHIT
jgi:hypothetical protein